MTRTISGYRSIYLGDQASRRHAIGKTIVIEVTRDIEERTEARRTDPNGKVVVEEIIRVLGRGPVRRQGEVTRAKGDTIWLGDWCYHVNEILAAGEFIPAPMREAV